MASQRLLLELETIYIRVFYFGFVKGEILVEDLCSSSVDSRAMTMAMPT